MCPDYNGENARTRKMVPFYERCQTWFIFHSSHDKPLFSSSFPQLLCHMLKGPSRNVSYIDKHQTHTYLEQRVSLCNTFQCSGLVYYTYIVDPFWDNRVLKTFLCLKDYLSHYAIMHCLLASLGCLTKLKCLPTFSVYY